jgi:hypothetical protein
VNSLGVIVPFSRPWLADWVRDNIARQTIPAVPIIVENGRAQGAWNHSGIIVRCEADRSVARNAGLEKCRELGLTHYAIFEDDDWYDAEYLASYWPHRNVADVLGKVQIILRDPHGKRWRMNSKYKPGPIKWDGQNLVVGIAAATIFGKVAAAMPWRLGLSLCEEIFWYTDMAEAGRTLHGFGPEHFERRLYDDPDHQHATPSWQSEISRLLEA